MINCISQIDSFELPNQENFRNNQFHDPKKIISDNILSSSSSKQPLNQNFNSYVKIIRTNSCDIQGIDGFCFANENYSKLSIPQSFIETNDI